MQATIRPNMQQLRAKFQVRSDNVIAYEKLLHAERGLFCLDARPLVDALQEFNIFYTLSTKG